MKSLQSLAIAVGVVTALVVSSDPASGQAASGGKTETYVGEAAGYHLELVTAASTEGLSRVLSGTITKGTEKYQISFGVLGVHLFGPKDPRKKLEIAIYETGKPDASPIPVGFGTLSYAVEINVIHLSATFGKQRVEIETSRK